MMGLPRQTAELLAPDGARVGSLGAGVRSAPCSIERSGGVSWSTTIARLHQLEQGGFRAALMAAVEAATTRSKELGH